MPSAGHLGLAFLGISGLYLLSKVSRMTDRQRVVSVAREQIGQQDPSKYWSEVLPLAQQDIGFKGHWCGGFALWCLRQAGLAESIDWVIGKGFCYQLPMTNHPEPGDIAYLERFQHHAIVTEVSPNIINSIDGNQLGSTVKAVTRARADITAFYSIKDLVSPVSR